MSPQQLFEALMSAGWPMWVAIHDPRLAEIFGSNAEALRKAAWRGQLPVPVTRGVGNRVGVRLTDLVAWMSGAPAGCAGTASAQSVASPTPRRGRPRKATLLGPGRLV